MRDDANGSQAAADVGEGAAQAMLGPNPFIGFRGEDVLATAGALAREAATHPTLVLEQQATLVRNVARVFAGESEMKPAAGDKRFADPAWTQNPFYRTMLGSYLAWTNALEGFIDASSFDDRTKDRARFVTRLFTDALSPSNALANPAALKKAIDTGGASVVSGLRNLFSDLVENGGLPSQVDKSGFEVGGNLGITPGSVVFRNDVLELIQYAPQTTEVRELPLLFVPPQINKYYVFDLSPQKSMIDFMLKGGIACYTISWRNPTAEQRDWTMDTYVGAMLEAIDAAREISRVDRINVVGACAGAMTLSALLGYLAAGDGPSPIASATLLVAVLVPETESTIGLFTTPETTRAAKAASARRGVLDGSEMGRIFAWLRPNDLVWNYWVNNYLLGNDPPRFDILYWNADTTRLPAAFHAQLIDAYAEGLFGKPGGLTVLGRPIDLRRVDVDSYFVAGITDHITPWKGVYMTMLTFGGSKTFVLSAAGHIQSLVNPPADAAKRQYFRNDALPHEPDAWLRDAVAHKGTWWGQWLEWLGTRSGDAVTAPERLGSDAHPPIVPAPGTYVLVR